MRFNNHKHFTPVFFTHKFDNTIEFTEERVLSQTLIDFYARVSRERDVAENARKFARIAQYRKQNGTPTDKILSILW